MEYTEVAQFPSSSSSKIYTVNRDENGDLSCTCPAWRFKKGDKPRGCKHVTQVAPGSGSLLTDAVVTRARRPHSRPPVEAKPAGEVMDGLLSGIEKHKAGSPEVESLTEKLRRLDRRPDGRI